MIIGDPLRFAIESHITTAYSRKSFKALGYFLIHLGGYCYGVRGDTATLLACSVGVVDDRISYRGNHTAPFGSSGSAHEIAAAYRFAFYSLDHVWTNPFGLSENDFREVIRSGQIVWAPDGDEAFDDGSYILQFDVGNEARLIGFKSSPDMGYESSTLTDVWLDGAVFYSVLREWRDAFEQEWQLMEKAPD